jgi:hypothetical protein
MLADEFGQLAKLYHAELAIAIGVKSLEQSFRRKCTARWAAIGTRSAIRTLTIAGHAITAAAGAAWWRAVLRRPIWRRGTVGTARFAVVSPTTSWSVGTIGAATVSTARAAGTTRATRAAKATLATATITIAWTAAFGTSAVRSTSIGTLRRELFANRHAQFHQLVSIECAVFVVIEQIEQFLPDFGISFAARWPITIFAVAGAGWLGERRQR